MFGRPSEWTSPVTDIETGLQLGHHDVSVDSCGRLSHLMHRHCYSGHPLTQDTYRFT